MNGTQMTFDNAEQDYLYPPDIIVHCQMCDEIMDIEEIIDPECIYCDECYKMFNETENDDENE